MPFGGAIPGAPNGGAGGRSEASMYAVIKTGGKQYRVAKDDVIQVERLQADVGGRIDVAEVLMIGDGDNTTIGAPLVADAKVVAEVVEQARGEKILVFKKKRRKNHRRLNGHRQELTVLRITDILPDGKPAAKKRTAKAKTETPAAAAVQTEAEGPESAPEPVQETAVTASESSDEKSTDKKAADKE